MAKFNVLDDNGQMVSMDSRDMNLTQLIALVQRNQVAMPVIKRYYLDTARTNEQVSIAGDYFVLINSSSQPATIDVSFNNMNANAITFTSGLKIKIPFAQFFITHTAQAGEWVDILIGSTTPLLEIIDNRTGVIAASILNSILNELQGPVSGAAFNEVAVGITPVKVIASNVNRRAFTVQADSANADKIYVAFDNTVAVNKAAVVLSPGQSLMIDDYRGDVYCISGTAAQNVFYGEW